VSNRPYYDDSDLAVLLEFSARAITGGQFTDEDQNVILRVVGAMLREAMGEPPSDPMNEESTKVVSALDPEWSAYIALGVKRRDAMIWKAFGFSPEQTRGWLENNVPMSVALVWSHTDPKNYEGWVRLGVDETNARAWEVRGIGPDEAQHWGTKIAWDVIEQLHELGPAEHVAPLYAACRTSINNVMEWVAADVPVEDAATWVEKGYTVNQAERLHREGKSAALVPDLRRGEPFATDSWKRIVTAARKNGWVVHEPERVTSGRYAPRLSVRFERGDTRYYGIFGTGGQFRGVVTAPVARWHPNAYDPGRMRTIDEFLRALHRPTDK
jgi:hypothetical protein